MTLNYLQKNEKELEVLPHAVRIYSQDIGIEFGIEKCVMLVNHVISECSKLAQKEYKSRHDWVSKMIHWDMCKKFQLDRTNKWYMHNPAPVLENDTHKLL